MDGFAKHVYETLLKSTVHAELAERAREIVSKFPKKEQIEIFNIAIKQIEENRDEEDYR